MTKQEITLAKFNACMVNTAIKYGPVEKSLKKDLSEFDKDKFHELLTDHNMGKYSELLFNYIFNTIELNQLNIKGYDDYFIADQANIEYRLELLKAFHFILTQQGLETKSVKLAKTKTIYFNIRNERLTTELETYIENLYKNNFKKMYSAQEIEFELQSEKNSKWITQWINEVGIQDVSTGIKFYSCIKDDEQYFAVKLQEKKSGIEIKKQIVADFRWSHPKKAEINLETIDELVAEYIKLNKTQRGPHSKNNFMTLLAAELADLAKVNRFLSSDKVDNIDQIKIQHPDYRFIYECLDFWTLIPSLEENSSRPESYMTTTIKQGKIYFTSDYYSARKERFAKLKEHLAQFE